MNTNISKHLRQICSIQWFEIIDLWAEKQKQYFSMYSNIKCHSYKKSIWLKQTDLSQETEVWKIKILIEPDKTLVEKNQILFLSDETLWELWKYLIENIIPNRNRKWDLIWIVLECKKQ